MAITKIIGSIHPPKSGGRYKVLKNTIDYITKKGKTREGYFVGSANCSVDSALREMIHTKNHYGKTSDSPRERLGYHYTMSWSPEENISHEEAFRILQEFCEKYLGSEYEAVYSVHTDRDHVHGHICFNSVNCETGRKFRYENGDWASKIQPLVDEICREHGFHTLEEDTGVTLEEYYQEHILNKGTNKKKNKGKGQSHTARGKSNNKYYNERKKAYNDSDYIRDVIDKLIPECKTFDEFIQKLRDNGFYVKLGKHVGVKSKGMSRFRRLYKLGDRYTEEAIRQRILQNGEFKTVPVREDLDIDQYIYVVPLEYRKSVRHTMTPQEKRYYGRMYYLSKAHPGLAYPTYRDVQQRIMEIRKLSEQIDFIREHDITSSDQMQAEIDAAYKEYEQLKEKKMKLYIQRKEYKTLISCVKEMHELFEDGAPDKARTDLADVYYEAKGQYDALMDEFHAFGMSWKEADAFVTGLESDLKEANAAMRRIKQRVEFYREIKENFEKEEEIIRQEKERDTGRDDRKKRKWDRS